MCRSIKKLRKPEGLATETEIHDAARQFIRKISGFREPSRENQDAFDQAIDDVSDAAKVLLETMAKKKNRKVDFSKV
ncbi:MAG TPA: DUF2277 domain-containing protein [Acidobacteriota bacterium]|nr:DUF2277 domain-containing protein [Acidobacteriota bacterium]